MKRWDQGGRALVLAGRPKRALGEAAAGCGWGRSSGLPAPSWRAPALSSCWEKPCSCPLSSLRRRAGWLARGSTGLQSYDGGREATWSFPTPQHPVERLGEAVEPRSRPWDAATFQAFCRSPVSSQALLFCMHGRSWPWREGPTSWGPGEGA